MAADEEHHSSQAGVHHPAAWLSSVENPDESSGCTKLPGAINVSFYDGHAEQVKLERLWQLHWHKGYVPPVKRPGL